MEEIVLYDLIKKESTDKEYIYYTIVGLNRLFCRKNHEYDYEFNGAACLVKNANHPGYCNLCIVYSKHGSDEFEDGHTITFAPLYDEDGNIVLVKYDHDSMFCSTHSRHYKGENIELVFWKNGVFEGF